MEIEDQEFFRLNSLGDIATLISNVCTFTSSSVLVILQVSYIIGSFIVDQVINFTDYFIKFLELINATLCILYEDSLIFFQDLGEKCIFFLNFCIDSIDGLINGLVNGIYGICNGVVTIGDVINNVINFFFSTSAMMISFCKEAAVLTKQMLILLGSSIWLCVTFIPTVLVSSYELLVRTISDCILGTQNLTIKILDNIADKIHNIIIFIFDLPLHSGYGLILGIVLSFIIFISFDKICALISTGLNKTYSSLVSFSSNLWSGKFLENKPKTEINDFNVLLGDENLCIICQENPKEMICLPCCHFCLCRECSNKFRKTQKTCLVCRKQVKKISKVYT